MVGVLVALRAQDGPKLIVKWADQIQQCVFGPNLAPKTAQEPPKIAQDRPRGAQNRPRAAQDGSQDALKTPPRPLWNLPERPRAIFNDF